MFSSPEAIEKCFKKVDSRRLERKMFQQRKSKERTAGSKGKKSVSATGQMFKCSCFKKNLRKGPPEGKKSVSATGQMFQSGRKSVSATGQMFQKSLRKGPEARKRSVSANVQKSKERSPRRAKSRFQQRDKCFKNLRKGPPEGKSRFQQRDKCSKGTNVQRVTNVQKSKERIAGGQKVGFSNKGDKCSEI